VRIELTISVNWEHGTGIDLIRPAATTHPMTIVGLTDVLAVV
jgi:hypothetical protein